MSDEKQKLIDGEQLLQRWVGEIHDHPDPHSQGLFDAARALIDLGFIDTDKADALVCPAFGWAARPSAGEVPASPFVRCIPVAAPMGGGFHPGLHALAVEVLTDGISLSFAGLPGGSPTSSSQRMQVYRDLQSLQLVDDAGTTYVAGPSPDDATLGSDWIDGGVGFIPAPGSQPGILHVRDASGRHCFDLDLTAGEPFGASTTARRRGPLDAQSAITYHLLDRLGDNDNSRPDILRAIASRAHVLAERLVAAGALSPDHNVVAELAAALVVPDDLVTQHLVVPIRDRPVLMRSEDRWLRRVIPVATDLGIVGRRRLVLRWLAIWSDRLRFAVSVYHGNEHGHDSALGRPRWRVADRSGWQQGAHSHNDWCGRPWTTYMMTVDAPLNWKGKQLVLSVDTGGEEVAISVNAGRYS